MSYGFVNHGNRRNGFAAEVLVSRKEKAVTDDKKKGDFEKWHKPEDAKGGDKKAHEHAQNSTGADKQNTGTVGHKG